MRFLDAQASLASTPVSPSIGKSVILSNFHSVSVSEPLTKRRDDIVVADTVIDMEVDMVADMEVDKVADIKRKKKESS